MIIIPNVNKENSCLDCPVWSLCWDNKPTEDICKDRCPIVAFEGVELFDDDMPTIEADPCTEFCKWVVDTVLPEDFEDKWTLGAFAEVACRKLYKLGFVRKDGEYWVKDEVKRMVEYIYEYQYGDGYASAGVKQKLVRCKECKYRYGDKDEPYCDRINPYMRMRVEDDDFCSWGEKNG